MKYRYYVCDVFTNTRFGGNPLAVLPRAEGLSDRQMQQIAREFNLSETTFVLPPSGGGNRQVRIFTPLREVPFAGHPNVGTAFVLASTGEIPLEDDPSQVIFEEQAGRVPVTIHRQPDGGIFCELAAPQRPVPGAVVPVAPLAAAVSLAVDDFVTTVHAPQVASVGMAFIVAEVRDLAALGRARPDAAAIAALPVAGESTFVHLYTRDGNDQELRARMFAPSAGVPEDPATGSANGALAGLLAHCEPAGTGRFQWRVMQGVEMGRPSLLELTAEKHNGEVREVRVGGTSVMVAEGLIESGGTA